MTVERMEGAEPTEQADAPTTGTGAENGAGGDAVEATPQAAQEAPASQASDGVASGGNGQADETGGETAAGDPAAADGTTAAADDDANMPEGTAGGAGDSPDVVTSDPSPNAAVGASGARPLGDAEEMADRVASAVDAMTAHRETVDSDATPAGPPAASDAAAPGPDADVTAVTAGDDTADAPPAADEPSDDGDPAMAAAAPVASAVDGAQAPEESPRAESRTQVATMQGPEPTTMEELLNEQPGEIRSLKHGDVVEGTVVRIDKDEILVDIGAKSEGVVSNRELYGRNAEAQPQLNVGDTVLVYVLQPESQEGHAVLSLRRAGLERKWRSMQEQHDAGVIIEAPVIDHNKGGLIVDCGIRGFVPISQIVDFPRRPQNEQPRDAAQEIAEKLQPYVGRKLRLKILEVNRKANRLILSEKVALYEERREKRDELFSSLQVGQKVKGTVRSIAPFGVFIDLGGIDGLVHKSELSWNKVNNPEAGYKVGEEVEAEVIDINHERGRISLSIRRLQPDPWHSTVADLKVNDLIDGTVTKIVNFGAFVRVRDGLEGLIHISELSHQRVAHPGDVVHEGQRLKLKIISLDSERHRLGLSLKQAEEAPARPPEQRERRPRQERGYDASQAVQEPEGGIDNTLAAAFAQVRQQMEETEAARRETEPADVSGGADETAAATVAPATAEPVAADETSEVPVEAIAPEVLADQPTDDTVIQSETADAPALEVGVAGPDAEPEAAAAEPEAAGSAPEQAATEAADAPDNEAPTTESTEADAAAPSADESSSTEEDAEPEARASADDDSGEPVADTSGEPSEGAPDAAPAAGADREDVPAS